MFVRVPRYFRLDGISIDRHDDVIPDEDTITTKKKQNSDCSFNLREEKLFGPPVVDMPNIDFTKIVTEESVNHRCSKVS